MCTALLLNDLYECMKFHCNTIIAFIKSGQNFGKENEIGGIALYLRKYLWFLCTALHLNAIYQCMKFHCNPFSTVLDIARTKCVLTDGHTDRQTDRMTDGRTEGQGANLYPLREPVGD